MSHDEDAGESFEFGRSAHDRRLREQLGDRYGEFMYRRWKLRQLEQENRRLSWRLCEIEARAVDP